VHCAAGVVGPALGAAVGLGRWFVGVAVLPMCGDLQRRRQHSAITAYRALPVCECPALGMPWVTKKSNAVSAVLSSHDGAHAGGCGRAGPVVCRGCSIAGLWRFPEEEVALGNHSAQSLASSVQMASPGHAMGQCSVYPVQQVWWGLHWVLWQG